MLHASAWLHYGSNVEPWSLELCPGWSPGALLARGCLELWSSGALEPVRGSLGARPLREQQPSKPEAVCVALLIGA